jgi:hypothetical protein
MQVNNQTLIVLSLYVDDSMVVSHDFQYLEHCKTKLNEEFAMIYKKDISYCLVIQII